MPARRIIEIGYGVRPLAAIPGFLGKEEEYRGFDAKPAFATFMRDIAGDSRTNPTKFETDGPIRTKQLRAVTEDILKKQIGTAKRLHGSRFGIGTMTGNRIPQPNEVAHEVWFNSVFCYEGITDQSLEKLLNEAHRVLVTGGHVIINDNSEGRNDNTIKEMLTRHPGFTFESKPDKINDVERRIKLIKIAHAPIYSERKWILRKVQ